MPEERQQAIADALRLIGKRLRSRAEIEGALAKRGYEQDIIVEAVTWLTEHGYINDRRYAEAFIHSRDILKPQGEFLLRHELTKRGVASEIIREVLEERKQEGEVSEESLAREVLRRKAHLYNRLDKETRLRRQISLLSRSGFSSETIRRILDM